MNRGARLQQQACSNTPGAGETNIRPKLRAT